MKGERKQERQRNKSSIKWFSQTTTYSLQSPGYGIHMEDWGEMRLRRLKSLRRALHVPPRKSSFFHPVTVCHHRCYISFHGP